MDLMTDLPELPVQPIHLHGGGQLLSCEVCGVVMGRADIHAQQHGMRPPEDWLFGYLETSIKDHGNE